MRFKSQKTILEVLHYNAFINRIISSKRNIPLFQTEKVIYQEEKAHV